MLAALVTAATLVATPPQADAITRNVVMDVCLPFVNGTRDPAAWEFLGFVVVSQEGDTTELASSDEQQRYLLRLIDDQDETDGEVARVCLVQARSATLDSVKSAVTRPLQRAGFVADAGQPANRPIWTRENVTVSVRQNEGRAAIVRVTYSSLEQ